jgi:hypothetical protein
MDENTFSEPETNLYLESNGSVTFFLMDSFLSKTLSKLLPRKRPRELGLGEVAKYVSNKKLADS